MHALLKLHRSLCLPAGKPYPPSMHICFMLQGTEKLQDAMLHVCSQCFRHALGAPPQKVRWKHHKDDKCP